MPRSTKSKPKRIKKVTVKKAKSEKQNKPKPIAAYDHKHGERVNNPPAGLIHADNDPDLAAGKRTYAYDPHLDPQLVWAGKAEHTSFDVPTLSLHVHERIDPRTIVDAVRKKGEEPVQYEQMSLFHTARENPPYREAIEFYKHKHNWSNRLIAGDSLIVMNSLLEKEGMAGQVQMVYIDPPYGIKYGSNFQPFVNKRDVKDGKDEDLTQEPEMVKAFRDTWELGIHSYLAYLRDRLLLAKELLGESGSVFVQISDENLHHVRELLDEVFGAENFCVLLCYRRLGIMIGTTLKSSAHYLVWYAKNRDGQKFRKTFEQQIVGFGSGDHFTQLQNSQTGETRPMSLEEKRNPNLIPLGWKPYQLVSLQTYGVGSSNKFPVLFEGKEYRPGANKAWRTTEAGIQSLIKRGRIQRGGETIRFKQFLDDFPFTEVGSIWNIAARDPQNYYVVQTPTNIIERCMHMSTDPGDIVLDPTCGSGTTAFVAEQWGRRWITCDTSRVALTLAKQRLMTALFDYYELAQPDEGVDSGFRYKAVPHITLKSIANNEPPEQETLYDQPCPDNSRARVSGPFTVEGVPAPTVKPLEDLRQEEQPADETIARSGETLRQSQWRDELLRTGIRGKGGQKIEFTRVEPLLGTRHLHADAETKEAKPQRVVVSFGSAFAPLDQTQVELALEEAESLVPKPKLVVFAAFQFDSEAAKDIEEIKWAGGTILKAQMNTDLLTDDLKKNRSSNESFWLVGQPDVTLERIKTGAEKGMYRVEVHGFDYYNTKTGIIESGSTAQIAMWLLDTDYDGRSLYPRQVFFPMAGEKDGWARLARNLKAEVDEERIEAYRGTVSLPFDAGKHKRVAVKIVDDRGIESLKVMEME